MGKAAENERVKLRATFHNNIGVGLTLVGVLFPTLNVMPVISKFLADLAFGQAAWSLDSVKQILISLVVFVANLVAIVLRRAADQEIGKIQD
jgi:hypothetical protein